VIAARYRVVRLLGRGGMGEVYEVVDTQLERVRALKLLHTHDASIRERFELEARLGGRIDSPHLVEVVDAGADPSDGRLYLVMELLVGESLAQRLDRLGARPAAEVIDHLAQVALALDRMHACGVVHRDLKPANLFLHAREGEPPRIKVLDLGIAKLLAAGLRESTGVAGTPIYMPPEQLRGRGIGPATDIYAIGMLAFTLLTGATYWTEAATLDPIAFAMLAVQGPPAPATERAREIGIELPADVDRWFTRATAADPRQRFPSASAAIVALAEAFAVEAPPAVVAAATASIAAAPPPDSAAADANATTDPPPGRDPPPTPPTVDATRGPTGASGASPGASFDGTTHDVSIAAPSRSRRRALVGAAIGIAAVVAVTVVIAMATRRRSAARTTAILADPEAVLACPILATEAPERDGWLGGAAAAMACERARMLRGGAAGITLAPAELLGMRGEPVDELPDDPFAAAGARDAAIAAARSRAGAYLDGRIDQTPTGFSVELVLRDPAGREHGRGRGAGAGLVEAVRAAMQPLVDGDGIVPAPPAKEVADFTRVRTRAALMRLVDVTLMLANSAGGLERECAATAGGAGAGELESWLAYECAYTLGRATPAVELPAGDSAGALAVRVRVDHMRNQRDSAELTEQLIRAYQAEATPFGRSALATTISCALQASAPRDALDWSQRSVQADPRNFTGERCAPWVQLATLALETDRARSVLAGWRAWAPWDSYAWALGADTAGDPERSLRFARRAYALSPFDAYVADRLADRLLAAGLPREAEAISISLATSALATHRTESELIGLRVEAAAGRFAAALRRAGSLGGDASDHGWVRQQRLELAWRALQVALVVRRGPELADRIYTELVAPEPSRIDGGHIDAPRRLAAICAYASPAVASSCFDRLEAMLPRLAGGVVASTRPFIDGARRFAANDLRGAAEAWRPLLASGTEHLDAMAEAMVRAFAAAGDHELVALIVERTAARDGELGGASLVTVRAAQAAAARGDDALAGQLAARVIAAWSTADTSVPVLGEMRALAP
jgi:hypothetical protein